MKCSVFLGTIHVLYWAHRLTTCVCVCVCEWELEGRGIPGTWMRKEESQQIYLLGRGHAEAAQMLELSKRHTATSEANLRGGPHSPSKQQLRAW